MTGENCDGHACGGGGGVVISRLEYIFSKEFFPLLYCIFLVSSTFLPILHIFTLLPDSFFLYFISSFSLFYHLMSYFTFPSLFLSFIQAFPILLSLVSFLYSFSLIFPHLFLSFHTTLHHHHHYHHHHHHFTAWQWAPTTFTIHMCQLPIFPSSLFSQAY